MPRATVHPIRERSAGYQLGIVREVLLALLAKEPSHAYELRARLTLALGPLADALNEGQVYVTLARLETSGLVSSMRVGQADRPDRKVYELTEAGRDRVTSWLEDVSWPEARAGGVSPEACRRRGRWAWRPGWNRESAAAGAAV